MVIRKYTSDDSIEGRRIGKSGDSYIISLPKQWLDQNGISQGDIIECLVNENRFVITQRKWSHNISVSEEKKQ